ncbi:nuclear transport factor 2 family protein [Roseicella aerolata]|uniref:Nuclear transport factor 2 family protein n=1 Tax=Roseicella aerolata TaxID=2883479 RepID=A0A9X1IFY4_9PROT|nr:nuclear transport factor 2 family protein [Roseicella aerolata]MCB4823827.1 nuclear transport factor 2 family protein [Roseicella aerolata]
MASGGFDFAALRRALERSDAAMLAALYAEDAELTIVDRNRPPSAPMRLLGRAAIEGFWQDVCSRPMARAVVEEVVGPDRIALVERCTCPDGCHVVSAMTLELRDGRIARQLTVQAWDELGCAAEQG